MYNIHNIQYLGKERDYVEKEKKLKDLKKKEFNMLRQLKIKAESPFTDDEERLEILDWFRELLGYKWLDSWKKMEDFKKRGRELSQ